MSDFDRCRIEYLLGGTRVEVDASDVPDVLFEYCDPVRAFPQWRGKRHYSGLFYMSSLRGHVAFESLLERAFLIELDRTSAVRAVSSQPMWLRWPGEARKEHAPDYFVRLRDGSGVVVDVKARSRIEASRSQFDLTAQLCRSLGWEYVVYSDTSRTREANLRFLLRFRDERWRLDGAEALLQGFAGSLRDAAARLGGGAISLGHCYALIWSGYLITDLDRPLALQSIVRWGSDLEG